MLVRVRVRVRLRVGVCVEDGGGPGEGRMGAACVVLWRLRPFLPCAL